MGKLKIGALISGSGTNLQAIIDACESGGIQGEVVFVGADHAGAKGLERADRHGIHRFVVDYRRILRDYRAAPERFQAPPDFDLEAIGSRQRLLAQAENPLKTKEFLTTRAAAESRLLAQMADHPSDLLVLAGFMRTLTPYFIDRYNVEPGRPRIMNIHPALLPAFPGVDGYGDTVRYGCKVAGCTVHFVDYGMDLGPIIGQSAFPVLPEDTLESVREKGLKLERELYPRCIRWFAQDRIRVVKMTYPLKTGGVTQRSVVKIARDR